MTSPSAGVIDVTTIRRIEHREAMEVAAVENAKFAAALAGLEPAQWATQTECERWDVRAMAAHVIGALPPRRRSASSSARCARGKPLVAEIGAEFWWDGMNEVQVRERATATTDELRAQWAALSPKALRARAKLPRPIARLPLLEAAGRRSPAAVVPVRRRASPVTSGCTASTSRTPRAGRRTSTPSTTGASSPTSSPSGRGRTASPSPCVIDGSGGRHVRVRRRRRARADGVRRVLQHPDGASIG